MELRGNLRDFSLPDIIQLVGFGRKTGVLRVDYGDGAALYFDRGHVVHAEHDGTVGEDAVYALFAVGAGEFQFHAAEPSPRRTITLDPTNLVMEAARRLDEAHREGPGEGEPGSGDLGDEWLEFASSSRDPQTLKQELRALLRRRFGPEARRLLEAVDRCGDSVEELLALGDRVERYVDVFLDSGAAPAVGREIRALLSPASCS